MKSIISTLFLAFLLLGCNGDSDGTVGLATNTDTNIDSDNTTSDISTQTQDYTLLAWNDLGMHCFDGKDFSVFSILPPYNNLNAQLIKNNTASDKLISSGVTLTYESLEYNGNINTSSSDKTNFWDFMAYLFPGTISISDIGLTGNKTPSATPQVMAFNSTHQWFEADGIPIVNYDDDGQTNYYPMVKVVARDSSGIVLATADVVLPVSDEMDCKKCHSSSSILNEARPTSGWENNADELKDYKFNILKLHDEKHNISNSYLDALNQNGYVYSSSLYDTAKAGTPILCAACHSSNALGTDGLGSTKSLTASIHSSHKNATDPDSNMKLDDSLNRSACYSCHPGSDTECLRGAMGSATDSFGNQTMQCQSCHGNISDVGDSFREGWMDQPNCQACHQNGQRYESALVNGSIRTVTDDRFATNPNTPSPNISLYRFSTGHGELQCSSCHGSTHAIYPTSHSADNVLSNQVQGHSGTIAECTSCHTVMPVSIDEGPHGMHSTGQSWVDAHDNVAENSYTQCASCHGSDYRGSFLSKTFNARSFNIEDGTKSYNRGDIVSCYDCHNGPDGEDDDHGEGDDNDDDDDDNDDDHDDDDDDDDDD